MPIRKMLSDIRNPSNAILQGRLNAFEGKGNTGRMLRHVQSYNINESTLSDLITLSVPSIERLKDALGNPRWSKWNEATNEPLEINYSLFDHRGFGWAKDSSRGHGTFQIFVFNNLDITSGPSYHIACDIAIAAHQTSCVIVANPPGFQPYLKGALRSIFHDLRTMAA